MSETKHTPGPWTIGPNSCCVTLPDGGVLVALTYGYCKGSGEKEDYATARLIAAAPDLLKALRAMMALDPPLTGNPSHAVLVNFWQSEKEQGNGAAETQLFALAAIAAATGETP